MEKTEIVAELRRIISAYFDYAKVACENENSERAVGHIEDGIAEMRRLIDTLEEG